MFSLVGDARIQPLSRSLKSMQSLRVIRLCQGCAIVRLVEKVWKDSCRWTCFFDDNKRRLGKPFERP